jgi:hypothetical protein
MKSFNSGSILKRSEGSKGKSAKVDTQRCRLFEAKRAIPPTLTLLRAPLYQHDAPD